MLMCFCEEPMILDNEAVNIFATRCGHIFHNSCLVQWLEKSESCPQCRSQVTESEMFRLYPALSDENPNDELNKLLQSCLECLDDTKLQLEEMTALCREKDILISNLKTDVEKVKTFGQENEALKSLLQMLDGLKDMATIICKTVDNSVQQDAVTQPRTELSDAEIAVTQTISEPPDADVAVAQSTTNSPDDDGAMAQPRAESSDADNAITLPRTEPPDADDAVSQPRAESTDNETMTALESSDADAGTQSRTEMVDADYDLTQPRTESHDTDETAVTQYNTSPSSTMDETAAIKSSLDTLGSLLIRISEIKNSNSQNQ